MAAKARHLLAQLVVAHPNMKTVVAKEIQHTLSRPNMEKKAQYQTICLLNQMELSRSASNKLLARRLIEIYFQFFEIYVKKSELEAKMLSALLTGVRLCCVLFLFVSILRFAGGIEAHVCTF